ncbi:serotransferrin-like [Cebus imitator]|uniref:serotransferrin-like n=1 Tax=Cebus imitator TaxID=2715852 RepID=UPI00189A1A8E|nr:serotransferrin-like [Cebus imitator]
MRLALCALPCAGALENLANKADRNEYELLCLDNTRKPADEYKDCHLARVPSHTIVPQSVGGKEDLIWELLNQPQVSPPAILPSGLVLPAWI